MEAELVVRSILHSFARILPRYSTSYLLDQTAVAGQVFNVAITDDWTGRDVIYLGNSARKHLEDRASSSQQTIRPGR